MSVEMAFCFGEFYICSVFVWTNFSWPCLHQWLETRPNRPMCPVCKAGISKDKVIPLYGRGNANQQDPRFVITSLFTDVSCIATAGFWTRE